jgi:hypothetical protein
MAFELELVERICCDAGDVVRIDNGEGPVRNREHIPHMSGCSDEVERQQKVRIEVSGAEAEDIYAVELVKHSLRKPHPADRASIMETMCAIAAQEHRILDAIGADRGGEILRVPNALFFLIV